MKEYKGNITKEYKDTMTQSNNSVPLDILVLAKEIEKRRDEMKDQLEKTKEINPEFLEKLEQKAREDSVKADRELTYWDHYYGWD